MADDATDQLQTKRVECGDPIKDPLAEARAWYWQAVGLRRAVDLFEPRLKILMKEESSGVAHEWFDLSLAYAMLAGMGVECALKGLIALRWERQPPPVHDIAALIDLAGVRTLARGHDEEVQHITAAIVWAGRYPFDRKGSSDKDIVDSYTHFEFVRDRLLTPSLTELENSIVAAQAHHPEAGGYRNGDLLR